MGIDIAPVRRGHGGLALDDVSAIADGTLAYVNRAQGNSNYGRYLVVLHSDPLGEVYTLYAHLADLAPGLAPGQSLRRGTLLGRMGHSSSSAIPVERSHLHFEIGLMLNRRFDAWFHAQRLTPDHGLWNGWNLAGVDPLAFYRAREEENTLSFARFTDRVPSAFEVILRARTRPDFFQRYPRSGRARRKPRGHRGARERKMAFRSGGVRPPRRKPAASGATPRRC